MTSICPAYDMSDISLLIHQSRAHRGHIQYEHLLQLFYNIKKKKKEKKRKKPSTNEFMNLLFHLFTCQQSAFVTQLDILPL